MLFNLRVALRGQAVSHLWPCLKPLDISSTRKAFELMPFGLRIARRGHRAPFSGTAQNNWNQQCPARGLSSISAMPYDLRVALRGHSVSLLWHC